MKKIYIITWEKKNELGFDFNHDVCFETKEDAENEIKHELAYDGVIYKVREVDEVFIYLAEYLNARQLASFGLNNLYSEAIFDFFENVRNEELRVKYIEQYVRFDELTNGLILFNRKDFINAEIEALQEFLK